MSELYISPEAVRDVEAIRRYIAVELKNPAAAKNTVRTIMRELRTLARFPAAGPSVRALTGFETDLRFFICGRHIALYRIGEKAVFVARIVDPRQDYLRVLFGDGFWEKDEQDPADK